VGGQQLTIGLVTLLLTGPFLWGQQRQLSRYGFTRQPQVIENNSARLSYYTYFLDYNILYSQLLKRESGQGQRLFPGLGLILLAGLGLWGPAQRRVKLYLLVAAGLALLLSLGLRLHLGQVQPYEWLRAYFPGFAQLRSPFRFAAWVQLHLALLAGFGLLNLGRWFAEPARRWLPAVIGALVLLESLALPLPLQAIPDYPAAPAWQGWLNQLEAPPQVVMLPFARTSSVTDFEQTVRWMLENRYFRGRIVNGYSGFFPQDHGRLREQMLKFPTLEGIAILQEEQVGYVVIHHQLAGAPERTAVQAYLPLVYWDETNQVAIYELPGIKFSRVASHYTPIMAALWFPNGSLGTKELSKYPLHSHLWQFCGKITRSGIPLCKRVESC
jgi:hypothetical protein